MAASINKVILISHVGKDPETRALQDSAQVVSFSLASSESWNDRSSGERREKTEWHRIVVMGNDHLTKIAASRVHKGSKVYLEGKLQTRKWQARDGTDHNTTEILLGRFNASLFLMDGCADQGGHYHTVSRPHTSAGRPGGRPPGRLSAPHNDQIPASTKFNTCLSHYSVTPDPR